MTAVGNVGSRGMSHEAVLDDGSREVTRIEDYGSRRRRWQQLETLAAGKVTRSSGRGCQKWQTATAQVARLEEDGSRGSQ
ncbi:hypothetical protein CEXT_173841 [Caerostris extrusa]|uniref:Uncharacterized protein n=1 Tax=Caerostris extrusa TaxID=172846 RepID=A0AAV4QIF5_CAEEX|nr:hypothetical protein CEXT_173841 [Caerostris extrusa]